MIKSLRVSPATFPALINQTVTPKQRAKQIIKRQMNTDFYILKQEELYRDDSMTDREWNLVQEQMHKYFDRIDKVIG